VLIQASHLPSPTTEDALNIGYHTVFRMGLETIEPERGSSIAPTAIACAIKATGSQ